MFPAVRPKAPATQKTYGKSAKLARKCRRFTEASLPQCGIGDVHFDTSRERARHNFDMSARLLCLTVLPTRDAINRSADKSSSTPRDFATRLVSLVGIMNGA
jgi:hypothetical protein